MIDLRDRIARILQVIMADLPDPPTRMPGTVDTARFLVDLALDWPRTLQQADHAGLEALSRKLAVAKQVRAVYDDAWEKVIDREVLAGSYWALMIALLLATSLEGAQASDADGAGHALKRLNAALTALDIAASMSDVPHLDELKSVAEERVERLGAR